MQKIAEIEPIVPSGSKPFLPWALASSTVVWIVMMLGMNGQFLNRFQQSYDFDAPSEMTVALIDTSIVMNLASKPDARTQLGRSTVPSSGKGSEPAAAPPEYTVRFLQTQAKNVTLDNENPSQEILSVIRTPTDGYQDYAVVEIDTTGFKKGGTLTVDIWVGSAEAWGGFILFPNDSEFSTNGMPESVLASVSGVPRGKWGKLIHRFEEGTIFKLGATGSAFGGEGQVNSFLARISVDTAVK